MPDTRQVRAKRRTPSPWVGNRVPLSSSKGLVVEPRAYMIKPRFRLDLADERRHRPRRQYTRHIRTRVTAVLKEVDCPPRGSPEGRHGGAWTGAPRSRVGQRISTRRSRSQVPPHVSLCTHPNAIMILVDKLAATGHRPTASATTQSRFANRPVPKILITHESEVVFRASGDPI